VNQEWGTDERAHRLRDFVSSLQPDVRGLTTVLDTVTAELFAAFEQSRVEALLLKGAALAQLLYRTGEHRDYVDIDVLTSAASLASAEQVLTDLGYRNATATFGIDHIAGHADSWLGIPPGASHQVAVELHRWLPGSRADPEVAWRALWGHRTSIQLNGRAVPVLNLAGQALHVATHAAQHGPQIRKGINELKLALERWPEEVWQQAAELGADVEAIGLFAAGLRLVPEGAQVAIRLGLPETPTLDWAIRNRELRPRGTLHLQALAEAKDVRARANVLRSALLPQPRWIRAEHPWARRGRVRLVVAYGIHLMGAPLWATRAARYALRARYRRRT
jgi:hypothetical protein